MAAVSDILVGQTPFQNRVIEVMRTAQETIVRALEDLERQDGSDATFGGDLWKREEGGGGWTRALAGGAVFEKGGVNVSAVRGEFSEEFAAQVPGSGRSFFATGISLVLHPQNPHVPTVHANFRYIEHGDKSWFGGGSDLTPYYLCPQDTAQFHEVWKSLCERHASVADYAAFRDWCDRYFYLPHRGERRGVGGIFFDSLFVDANDDRREQTLAFVREGGDAFLDAYLPIVRRRQEMPATEAQRHWQEIRRGRYVEFNLLHDRGTLFGLKTGGRTESILMSLPPRVRFAYGHEPEEGTPEAALLQELRRPLPQPGLA